MSLPPPPPEAELLQFPSRILQPTESRSLYRITRRLDTQGRVREPLYFGMSGKARFDLLAPNDRGAGGTGTCYLGTKPLACFVEKFGDLRIVPPSEVMANVLATVRMTRELRVADMCDGRVLGRFGLTAEIWSSGNYIRPQEWARALHHAGFDGILYGTRHDPGGQLRAVAIFGSGPANPLAVDAIDSIPESLLDQAWTQYGLLVEEPPHTRHQRPDG